LRQQQYLSPTASLSGHSSAVQDASAFNKSPDSCLSSVASSRAIPSSDIITACPTANTSHQAYNSVFNSDPNTPRLIGNFPLLPLRTKTRGPAYTLPIPSPPLPAHESPDPDDESYDILDEVLALFRANTFFRNFEIQGPADRLLVYGIWFVSDCLTKIRPHASLREAQKDVMNIALDSNFAIPGDPSWPLNQVCLMTVSLGE
jgi:hypothetical protein